MERHDTMCHDIAKYNLQSKIWISTALKKANIAVLYDERGHFRNAIFYYLEAVGLLSKAIHNPDGLKSETDGLKMISDIYFNRIEHLYNITQKQQIILYASDNTYSSKKYPNDTKEHIPEMIENNEEVAESNKKHDSISSTFSKLFSKKSLKINTKQKENDANNGILSPLKQFTRHSSLRPGKSSKR